MFCPISQTEKEGSADIQKLGAESSEWAKWVFCEVFYPMAKLGQGILYSLEDFVCVLNTNMLGEISTSERIVVGSE